MATTLDGSRDLTLVDQVFDLLDGYIASSVVGTALESNLFWILDGCQLSAEEIAEKLDMPIGRCRYWLQYLGKLDLIAHSSDGYGLTNRSQLGIVDAYSHESWAFLARETRERYAPFEILATHFNNPGSLWDVISQTPPNYIEQMKADPDRALQFTRMLYEIHQELAVEIARRLDLRDVRRMMDIGGGSGVVSMACLKNHPDLEAVVVDIPNVCQAGSTLASERGLIDRINYQPLDIMIDDLPIGFDLVIECDVAVYEQELFQKVYRALNPGGRFVIVDQFAPSPERAPSSRLVWALQGSINNPDFRYRNVSDVEGILDSCGFEILRVESLDIEGSKAMKFSNDMMIIESQVPG